MTNSTPSLSTRGAELANNPARIDFELFMEAAENSYHPEDNPEGAFPLNVAENSPALPIIKEKLSAILQQQEIPDWVLQYTGLLGHAEVREEVARFMTEKLCHCPISAETIGFSAGAAAVIEVTSFVLADAGDVVVIPAPSYPMYTKDLGIKSGMERYNLQTHHEIAEMGSAAPVTVELLEETWANLRQQNKCFKILLLSSPDNPTGCRYTEQDLRKLATWCMEHRVHLIVNEIYGLSLINTQDSLIRDEYETAGNYVSFAQIMADHHSDYLHLWYAFSKDFAMSGLRFGVLHTLNEGLLTGFANANVPHLVSNITQWLVAEMLKDTAFLDRYIATNNRLLNESYQIAVKALRKIGVSYVPSRGSLFVWADFSRFLSEDSEKGQEQLWIKIYRKTGVLLTPGAGFEHSKKGLFRVVFTAVPAGYLEVAMGRLVDYLKNIK